MGAPGPSDVAVRLVRLRASDGHELDALRYDTDASSTIGVLHVHGKGASFLTGPSRFLPARWPGVTHLALNMRFRDLAFTDAEGAPWAAAGAVPARGGYWERIADGPLDLGAGVQYLKDIGCRHVVIVGHSSGGFYTARYSAQDPDGIAARVFIGPLTSNRTAFPRWFGSDDAREAALENARSLVEAGRGHELIPLSTWYYAVSAASLLERAAEPEGIWLEAVNANPSPTLLVWGSREDRGPLWSDLFERFTMAHRRIAVVEGAEHHFVNHEDELTGIIRSFIEGLDLHEKPDERSPTIQASAALDTT
jgi:pimeloyl-ACP methyl ester carboxylesterase